MIKAPGCGDVAPGMLLVLPIVAVPLLPTWVKGSGLLGRLTIVEHGVRLQEIEVHSASTVLTHKVKTGRQLHGFTGFNVQQTARP